MVEWTVYLKNIGTSATPIIKASRGWTARFGEGRTAISSSIATGETYCTTDSYEPYDTALNPSSEATFRPCPTPGKSCDGPKGWPYYNLQTPGGGMILAIGWPGQWASSFTRDAANGLRIKAGQQLTHLYLNPGEEIRTPLIGLFFWQGTDMCGHKTCGGTGIWPT